MKPVFAIILVLGALLLAGCASTPTPTSGNSTTSGLSAITTAPPDMQPYCPHLTIPLHQPDHGFVPAYVLPLIQSDGWRMESNDRLACRIGSQEGENKNFLYCTQPLLKLVTVSKDFTDEKGIILKHAVYIMQWIYAPNNDGYHLEEIQFYEPGSTQPDCVSNYNNVASAPLPPPESIALYSWGGGSFAFMLQDKAGHYTPGNGTVQIRLSDDLNTTLYSNEFNVSWSNYSELSFGRGFSTSAFESVYQWTIPTSDIQKGIITIRPSLARFGLAQVTFITSDGRTLSAEHQVSDMPAYSDAELNQMWEDGYEKDAVTTHQTITKVGHTITVTRFGLMNVTIPGGVGHFLRVDLEGTVSDWVAANDAIYPTSIALSNGTRYSGNELEGYYMGQFAPGKITNGSFRFNTPPPDEKQVQLRLYCGLDEKYQPILWTYDLNLKQ